MANEFVLTKKGKQDLEAQLEYLKTVKRAEISEQIKVARSFGDLSRKCRIYRGKKRTVQNRRQDPNAGKYAAHGDDCG